MSQKLVSDYGPIKQYSSGNRNPSSVRNAHAKGELLPSTYDFDDYVKIKRGQNNKKWRQCIRENGFVKCPKSHRCGMCFLSVKGMEVHDAQCIGDAPTGFVQCPICKNRFTTFTTVERHRKTSHPDGSITSTGNLTTQQSTKAYKGPKNNFKVIESEENVVQDPPEAEDLQEVEDDQEFALLKRKITEDFAEEEDSTQETAEELQTRILRESKLLGRSKSVGRPKKKSKTQRPSETFDNIFDIDQEAVAEMENATEEDRHQQVLTVKQTEEDFAFDAQIADILSYKEKVVELEKSAEEATKAVLEEQSLVMQHLEEDLRQREMKAKEKIMSAIKIWEEIQMERKRRMNIEHETL